MTAKNSHEIRIKITSISEDTGSFVFGIEDRKERVATITTSVDAKDVEVWDTALLSINLEELTPGRHDAEAKFIRWNEKRPFTMICVLEGDVKKTILELIDSKS